MRTFVLYGNQQKFNIEAVNDYPPIRFEIRFQRKFPIRRSLLLIPISTEWAKLNGSNAVSFVVVKHGLKNFGNFWQVKYQFISAL